MSLVRSNDSLLLQLLLSSGHDASLLLQLVVQHLLLLLLSDGKVVLVRRSQRRSELSPRRSGRWCGRKRRREVVRMNVKLSLDRPTRCAAPRELELDA